MFNYLLVYYFKASLSQCAFAFEINAPNVEDEYNFQIDRHTEKLYEHGESSTSDAQHFRLNLAHSL